MGEFETSVQSWTQKCGKATRKETTLGSVNSLSECGTWDKQE